MSIFKKTVDFKVNPAVEYNITVFAGEGQLGRVVFKKPDGKIFNQEIVEQLQLGKGDELLSKKIITISAMVIDVQSQTNRTSLTVQLNDEDIHQPFEQEADDDNGSVFYKIKIQFQS